MCLCVSVRQKSRSLGDKLGDSSVVRVMGSACDDGECLSAWYSQASVEAGENEGCNSSTAAIWMIHYVIVCDWTPTIMPDCRCWLPPALSSSIFHLQDCSLRSAVRSVVKYEYEETTTWTSYLSFTEGGDMKWRSASHQIRFCRMTAKMVQGSSYWLDDVVCFRTDYISGYRGVSMYALAV